MSKDTITKEYMKDKKIFSDVFNYYVFDGKQIIKEEDLKELDTNLIEMDIKDSSFQRYRDVYKEATIMLDDRATYFLLGIENQSNVDYSMVIRNMLYDSLSYRIQVRDIEKKNKNGKMKMNFISGLRKEDRIKPVISLVVYFGMDKWDGPKDLHSMFKESVRKKEILQYVPNYKLNIIEPYRMKDEDFDKLHSELKIVLQFIKYSNNKEKIKELIDNCEPVEKETVMLINEVTDAKMNYETKEGKVVMCQAIKEMLEDAKTEGKAEGIEENNKKNVINFYKNGVSKEIISKSLNITIEEVNKILESSQK